MTNRYDVELMQTVLNGTVVCTEVPVQTTAVALPANPLENRKYLLIHNKTGGSVYVGGESVTTTAGIELAAGAIREFPFGRAELYAVRATGSGNVYVLEVS